MATIRTHTTLRTLFAATAVFAVLAAVWTTRTDPILLIPITPCGTCFVAGLLGFSVLPSFAIGLMSSVAAEAHRIASVPKPEMRLDRAFWYATDHILALGILFGTSWVTAWWWGKFLRYTWSKPKRSFESEAKLDNHVQTLGRKVTWKETMLARCEESPVAMFLFTVFANIFIVMVVALVVFA